MLGKVGTRVAPTPADPVDMFGAHQLAVQIPDRGVCDHSLCVNLHAVLQAHPEGLPVADQDLINHRVVERLPAQALESSLDLVGQHLRAARRVIDAAI